MEHIPLSEVVCHERLGGLLRHYERKAAQRSIVACTGATSGHRRAPPRCVASNVFDPGLPGSGKLLGFSFCKPRHVNQFGETLFLNGKVAGQRAP